MGEDLTLVAKMAKGGFGAVMRGNLRVVKDDPIRRRKLDTTQAVAAKEMMGSHDVKMSELLKEAHVMASLKHDNICKFIGVCSDGKRHGKRYIVSELLDCSLFDLCHRPTKVPRWQGTLTINLVVSLSEGIVSGLVYLHSKDLVHADMKSSNVLIDLSCRPEDNFLPAARICDFGHAAVRVASMPHNRLCTPHWAAP